jgi:hypothetical protein
MYVNANNVVGINTSAPSAPFALDVNGLVNASGIRINNLDSATGTIDCEVNSLSNILNLNVVNARVSGTLTADGNFTSSNMSVQGLSVNTLNVNSTSVIESYAPMFISGYSTNLYTVPEVMFGNTSNATRISLRVSDNVIAKAYLSLSDRRIKKDVVETKPSDDLLKILATPVYTFNMIDPTMQENRLAGFIAQEVEQTIPSAVRTTYGAIPNVMASPERVREDGYLIQLSNHPMQVGDYVKFLVDENEFSSMVTQTTLTTFRIKTPIPANAQSVYIYGKYVADLKMVDNDQLLPIVFNAVKDLHKSISKNQALLQSILTRLSAIENSMI